MGSAEDDAAFYRKHYSDWTVHALRLTVRVPMTVGHTEADALALVREVLDDARFDIRVTVDDQTEGHGT